MGYLISVPVGDDEIVFEVGEDDLGRVVPAGRVGEIVARATQPLEEGMAVIERVAEVMLSRLQSVASGGIDVEFAIKVTAEAGVVIANTSAEASFKVTIHWKPPS